MPAVDIAYDPWLIAYYAQQMGNQLPAFLNIRTCRHLWHAGAGCDGPPQWHRLEITQKRIDELGWGTDRLLIEEEEKERATNLWKDILN